jgi:hypothetical protein
MTDKLFRVVWKSSGIEAEGAFFVEQDGDLCERDYDGMDYVGGIYGYDFSTGFHDRDATPVFENDLVAFDHSYWTHAEQSPDTITAVVTWDQKMGAWTLVNTQNSKFRVLLSKHIRKGKVVGRAPHPAPDAQ